MTLLTLPPSTTQQDVRPSYRLLAKRYHPDTGGSHEAFIELQKACEAALQWVGRDVQKVS
jgi:curved DNA-binding protein CbpA